MEKGIAREGGRVEGREGGREGRSKRVREERRKGAQLECKHRYICTHRVEEGS